MKINEQAMCIFDVVIKYLDGGGYVVIAKSDIHKQLAQSISQREMDECLNMLQMGELIKIRYTDKEVYCMTVLPEGIKEHEKRKEAKAKRETEIEIKEEQPVKTQVQISTVRNEERVLSVFNIKKLALVCGLSGFLGALLAGIVTIVIVLCRG